MFAHHETKIGDNNTHVVKVLNTKNTKCIGVWFRTIRIRYVVLRLDIISIIRAGKDFDKMVFSINSC
jgi:hypothetical protein